MLNHSISFRAGLKLDQFRIQLLHCDTLRLFDSSPLMELTAHMDEKGVTEGLDILPKEDGNVLSIHF